MGLRVSIVGTSPEPRTFDQSSIVGSVGHTWVELSDVEKKMLKADKQLSKKKKKIKKNKK